MTARPQSCLLPAVFLVFIFFCDPAFAAKKNNANKKAVAKGKNFCSANYTKKRAGKSRDIRPVTKQNGNSSFYIVKKGDTLFNIAKKSDVKIEDILSLNNIDNKSKIFIGMKLKLPLKCNTYDNNRPNNAKNNTGSARPHFLWPLAKVKSYTRDNTSGVKPIGIIIKSNPGEEVIASDDGIVKKVGYMRGYGKYIVVGHPKRFITVYSNLMDIEVKAGDKVQRGVRIGNISNDMTLHFQIDREGKPENPLKFLPDRG